MKTSLEYYRTFYYVATLQNMGKAASLLCLSAPSVTKTIQILEQQLDCQLFVRSKKGVTLTPEGQALYERVNPAFNLLMRGEEEIELLNSLARGLVTIGVNEASNKYFLLPVVIQKFRSMYPGVRVKIVHISSYDIKDSIDSGRIDFAVAGIPQSGIGELDVRDLFVAHNIAIAGPNYDFLTGRKLSLTELSQYPLVFVSNDFSIRDYYLQIYAKQGLEFVPDIETPSLDIQLQAVQLGLGYSYVPDLYVNKHINDGSILKLDLDIEQPTSCSVCLSTYKNRQLSKAAQTFVDILLECAESFGQGE